MVISLDSPFDRPIDRTWRAAAYAADARVVSPASPRRRVRYERKGGARGGAVRWRAAGVGATGYRSYGDSAWSVATSGASDRWMVTRVAAYWHSTHRSSSCTARPPEPSCASLWAGAVNSSSAVARRRPAT